MSCNTTTAQSVAPIFLTRPLLFLGINPSAVEIINKFLETFLTATCEDLQELKLQPGALPSLATIAAVSNPETNSLINTFFGRVPFVEQPATKLAVPAPLALACHFFSISWNDWFLALGGARFKLVLKPTCVYVVKKSDGCIGVVWTAAKSAPTRAASPALSSAIDHSDSEDSSRPSSRSSNYSSFSFSSHSSVSSQSSAASTSFTPSSKPAPPFATTTPTQASFTRPLTNTMNTRSAPKPAPTKYLYQGGVSTVLTGGVMLGGAPKAAAPPPKTAAAARRSSPLYTVHASSTKLRDPTGPSGTWRRTTPVAA
ncbi:hypothetical protein DXG01_000609 [Tephrocybe rancida]|nr:hypothetical protein DXG01_000609 [Tephrocybe rancida]